jgi:hypothetical protein
MFSSWRSIRSPNVRTFRTMRGLDDRCGRYCAPSRAPILLRPCVVGTSSDSQMRRAVPNAVRSDFEGTQAIDAVIWCASGHSCVVQRTIPLRIETRRYRGRVRVLRWRGSNSPNQKFVNPISAMTRSGAFLKKRGLLRCRAQEKYGLWRERSRQSFLPNFNNTDLESFQNIFGIFPNTLSSDPSRR